MAVNCLLTEPTSKTRRGAEIRNDHESEWAAMNAVADLLVWVAGRRSEADRQAEIDTAAGRG